VGRLAQAYRARATGLRGRWGQAASRGATAGGCPARKPGEGAWHHGQHVARRPLCGVNLPPRGADLGRALRRFRRTPDVLTAVFAAAGASRDMSVLDATLSNPWTDHRDVGAETLEEFVQPRGKMPIVVISFYRQS
jgi:hypothetical protein